MLGIGDAVRFDDHEGVAWRFGEGLWMRSSSCSRGSGRSGAGSDSQGLVNGIQFPDSGGFGRVPATLHDLESRHMVSRFAGEGGRRRAMYAARERVQPIGYGCPAEIS